MADAAPRRAAGTSYEVIDGEAVVIDPDGQELVTLNAVGTLVWEHLDGRRGIDELVDVLLSQLDGVSREELDRDVRDYLDELRSAGLVE
jgi:hypothetical protein